MMNHIPFSSAPLRGALSLIALFGFAASQIHAQNYSAYYTVQPNVAGTAVVHTISWAALDTQHSGAVYDSVATPLVNEGLRDKINRNTSFGNANSTLDDVNTMAEANYTFDNTANGGAAATVVRYRHTASGGNPVSNVSAAVYYQNPLITTITPATFAPSLSTPSGMTRVTSPIGAT